MKIILIALISIAFLSSCRERKSGKPLDSTIKVVENKTKPSLNFYIEDGGSMHGFFKDSSDFSKSVADIYWKIKRNSTTDKLTFIQNEKLETQTFSKDKVEIIENIEDHFREDKIGGSDLFEMIKKCLNETNSTKVSALVSDFIYADDKISNFESKLADLLDEKGLDICVVKLNSSFVGNYYFNKNVLKKRVKINNVRPYYIWFFGTAENFKKLNITDNTTYSDLSGFENFITYSKNNFNKNIEYSILPYTLKKGRFEINRAYSKLNTVKGIQNIEYDRNGNHLEFSLAIDLNSIPLNDSYLTDITNYSITNGDYKILKISRLNNYKFDENLVGVSDQKLIDENSFTHIFIIQSIGSIPYDIEFSLNKKTPKWLSNSSSDNENNIEKSTQTYNLSKFLNAFDKVYNKSNNNLLTVKLKLGPGNNKNKNGLIVFIVLIIGVVIYVIYKRRK